MQRYIDRFALQEIITPELQKSARLVSYRSGQLVMRSGNPIQEILILVEGALRVYSISEDGKLGIVALAEPPQMLGDIEYIQGIDSLHSVEAETRATLISIPLTDVQAHLSSNVAFYRMICNNLVSKLYKTSSEYSRALLYPAKNRFASYLLDRMNADGIVVLNAGEAAQNLGITTRHMSRIITAMEQDQILCRKKAKTLQILNHDALNALTNF